MLGHLKNSRNFFIKIEATKATFSLEFSTLKISFVIQPYMPSNIKPFYVFHDNSVHIFRYHSIFLSFSQQKYTAELDYPINFVDANTFKIKPLFCRFYPLMG